MTYISNPVHPHRGARRQPRAGFCPPPLPSAAHAPRSVVVARNERGNIVGQRHPRALLSDADIDMIRALHEDRDRPLGYRQIARKFETSVSTVRGICNYERRVGVGMRHSYRQPGAAAPATPATPQEIERRFCYRLETLLNDIAGELNLHRNTVASVVYRRESVRRTARLLKLERSAAGKAARAAKRARKPPAKPPARRKKPAAKSAACVRTSRKKRNHR